jgi:EAL domain-containing protein (putative c-di-GMP-specific phosphodiesterase class I)
LNDSKIYGYEALLRGHSKLPEVIITEAIQRNLILQLDTHVHQLALEILPTLTDDQHIFINCHPKSLKDLTHLLDLQRDIKENGKIVLEITENQKLVMDEAKPMIDAVQKEGIHIALDDFGVGNNNIYLLKDLDPDYIKIDKCYIQNLNNKAIYDFTKLLVNWSKENDTKIIAEGIENITQLRWCKELGITLGQGWLYGKPQRKVSCIETVTN